MSIEITNWLRGLGLERFATAFLANDIDAEILPKLTADDLIGLGVTSIGHRRKLLDAIATLRDGSPDSDAPVPSTEPVRRGGDAGIAAGSGRFAGSARRLSRCRGRGRRRVRGLCRQVYGRRRPHLFRVSAGT